MRLFTKLRWLSRFAGFVLTCATFHAATLPPKIEPMSEPQSEVYKLGRDFLKKGTLVQDILVATSTNIPDFTHFEVAHPFDMTMKSLRPDIAKRIRERKVLCVLVGRSERTSDVPMFISQRTGKELNFYNWRQHVFLTTRNSRQVELFSEQDVLKYEGGMQLKSMLTHEFGHGVQGTGFDKMLKARVKAAFENAKQKGIYNDGYAAQKLRRVKSKTPVSLLV